MQMLASASSSIAGHSPARGSVIMKVVIWFKHSLIPKKMEMVDIVSHNTSIEMDNNVSLEYMVIGDDEAVEVTWYKVSDEQEEDEELLAEEDGSLIMDGVILADAGEYKVAI